MENFHDLMQTYVNYDYDTLLLLGKRDLLALVSVFDKVASDGKGISLVLPFICTSLAADGKLSPLEYKYLTDLLGELPFDQTRRAVKNHGELDVLFVDKIFDACPAELKSSLLSFCLCFLAVDKTISREEVAFINRLLQ